MRLAACVLLALLASLPAAAADSNGLPTATPTKDEVEKMREKVVCKREVPVGSLIAVRRCTTKVAADIERENAQRLLDRPIPGNGSN